MNTLIGIIIGAIIGLIGGYFAGMLFVRRAGRSRIGDAEAKARQIIEEAEHQQTIKLKEAELSAKDKLIEMKHEFERETQSKHTEIRREERKLTEKQSSVERKMDLLRKKERA